MPKPVAVILLNWNTPVHTANCIRSLRQYADESLFDIIVVDNGSTDNSVQLLKTQFKDIIFIENGENLGFAEGNNRALQYSIANSYVYSLLINTDTLVDENIIAKLKMHLDVHPEASSVQPAIFWMHKPTHLWNGKGCFNKVLGLTFNYNKIQPGIQPSDYKKASWNSGCCMLIRNGALQRCGKLNSCFFLYYEDVELCFRFRRNGYEVHYLPSAKIYHEAGVSAKVEKSEGYLSPVIHYYVSRNRIWLLREYGSRWFYPVYLIGGVLYYGTLWLYFKLRNRNEKARQLIKGVKEGMFTPKSLIWPEKSIAR
jgi:GT2 family glycosyltransferase